MESKFPIWGVAHKPELDHDDTFLEKRRGLFLDTQLYILLHLWVTVRVIERRRRRHGVVNTDDSKLLESWVQRVVEAAAIHW
jgi:hypothetical protein